MSTFFRFCYEAIIYFSCFGMASVFFIHDCTIAFIFTLLIIAYFTYRAYIRIVDFDFWGIETNPNNKTKGKKLAWEEWEGWYAPKDKKHSKTIIYGGSIGLSTSEMDELKKTLKLNANDIQLVETVKVAPKTKDKIIEVFKPKTKSTVEVIQTKADKKEHKDDKVSINPNDYNKELIMLINDDKLSKNVTIVYDCIISALKGCNLSTSNICGILQGFPYVDFVNDTAIIYINERSLEGVVVSKIKRKIITNINERFENKVKTSFQDMKYLSVFDYFVKTNAV